MTVKMVFSFGFSSSAGAAAGVAAAAAAGAAEAEGIAISVILSRVLSIETSSEASNRVSVSIWSTIVFSLELLLLEDDGEAVMLFVEPVAGGDGAAPEFGEIEAEG